MAEFHEQKRRTAKGLVLSAAILFVSCGVSSAASESNTTRAIEIPVTSCRTNFALASPPTTVAIPSSMAATIPSDVANRVSFYSDSSRILTLIGPRGWICDAMYGADGSGGLIIYPQHESVPLQSWGARWSLSPGSRVEAITAFESGGSVTQGTAEACPYFPGAARATKAAFGHGCASPPKSERISQRNSHAVFFDDAKSLKGGGTPSGGQNSAAGLITYIPTKIPTSYRVTCTIPQSSSSICVALQKQFLKSYGKR